MLRGTHVVSGKRVMSPLPEKASSLRGGRFLFSPLANGQNTVAKINGTEQRCNFSRKNKEQVLTKRGIRDIIRMTEIDKKRDDREGKI